MRASGPTGPSDQSGTTFIVLIGLTLRYVQGKVLPLISTSHHFILDLVITKKSATKQRNTSLISDKVAPDEAN